MTMSTLVPLKWSTSRGGRGGGLGGDELLGRLVCVCVCDQLGERVVARCNANSAGQAATKRPVRSAYFRTCQAPMERLMPLPQYTCDLPSGRDPEQRLAEGAARAGEAMERKTTWLERTTVVSGEPRRPTASQGAGRRDDGRAARHGTLLWGKTAKELPEYDAHSAVLALFSWHGTVMPLVLKRGILVPVGHTWHFIYLKLLRHLDEKSKDDGRAMRTIQNESGARPVRGTGPSSASRAADGVLLGLYANLATRAFQMYTHCIAISGSSSNGRRWSSSTWASMVSTSSGTSSALHAAAHVQYYTLQGASLSEEELSVIQGRDLLSVEECSAWSSSRASTPFAHLLGAERVERRS